MTATLVERLRGEDQSAATNALPAKPAKQRSPIALLHALKEAGHVSHIGCDWTEEIIEYGNKCDHCVKVDPRDIRSSIAAWHTSIDNDPCGEPTERVQHMKPKVEGYDVDDCDDDDGAGWWKSEGGAV